MQSSHAPDEDGDDDFEPSSTAAGRGSGSAVRWSGIAVITRQAAQLVTALVMARVLGPNTYGVISAATVYVTLTTLVLDQGLAAAVVQRPRMTRRLVGAVATANLLTASALGLATLLAAPAVAHFFGTSRLTPLLQVLGAGLLLKGLAITPRAVQQRRLAFKKVAVADVAGGVLGAAAGLVAVLAGAGTWSMAVQVLTTDALIALVLMLGTRGVAPNAHLGALREILPFSARIFGSNALAFLSRNSDNILVGRYLGVGSLSLYSMAYRVLVIPVQMIGQTVNRVAFPTFSRLVGQRERLASSLMKITELLAFAAVPVMGLVAVAAPELIDVVLGSSWSATAPVLTVLAIAGARETVFYVTGSLMRAKGEGRLILRYEFLATGLQVTGIVVGLQFGLLGVAIGLTSAGFALIPVLLLIQRRLSGVSIRAQLGRMAAPVHASAWGALAYWLLRLLELSSWATALLGGLAYLVVLLSVLVLLHRRALRRAWSAAREIFVSR